MHETSILNNTTFWYVVAFAAFFILAFRGGRKAVVAWLDGEIAKVRNDLDEAKRLRVEAEAALETYRARERDAMQEAEKIVTQAKADAERLRQEAKEELKASLERHEALALDRIRLAREEAAAEVRAFIVEESMLEARGKLAKMAGTAEATQLVDTIIADLPKLGKTKVA